MTDLEKTKQLFDEFKIPYEISKGGDSICLIIDVGNPGDDIVDGYFGFATEFLFKVKDEKFYQVRILE